MEHLVIRTYAYYSDIMYARKMFDEMPERDLVLKQAGLATCQVGYGSYSTACRIRINPHSAADRVNLKLAGLAELPSLVPVEVIGAKAETLPGSDQKG